MDVSHPGFGAAGVPNVTLGLEGALKTVGKSSTSWPSGAQATYESQFRAALAPPAAGDPVVAPPTYGSNHSGSTLPAPGAAPVWLGQLNLDPRPRAAASAAAQVVQKDQDALVASAWEQWGEIRKVNQMLRQAQLARQVSTSLSQRHLGRVAGDGKWLQITAPLASRVRVTLAGVTATVAGQVRASLLPTGSLSPAMRRISRPNGPIGRQLKPGVPQIVDRLNVPAGSASTALQVAGPRTLPKGMVAFDDISTTVQVKDMTALSFAGAPGWQLATQVITGTGVLQPVRAPLQPADHLAQPVGPGGPVISTGPGGPVATPGPTGPTPTPAPPLVNWKGNPNLPVILKGTVANLPPPIVFPSDSAALEAVKTNFRTAAQSVNDYLNTAPAAAPSPPPLGGQAPLAPVRAQILTALNPSNTLRARLAARIPLNTGTDPLQPTETGPKYPQAMYAPLAQLSPDWMLPGVSQLDPDCATLLATNPAFIEAYMVGLNDELARELLWREYPADRRVTFFQNFWSSSNADIGAIAAFNANTPLGGHVLSAAGGNQLVLLIRATLFQRYPNAIVYAAQATWVNGVRQLTTNVQYPAFRGAFGQDINFFGFNIADPKGSDNPAAGDAGWYFVIAEHVTEPRLGLEPQKSTTPTGFWNDLSWDEVALKGNYVDPSVAPPTPAQEPIAWSENSAALGYILMREPVRVAMHALALLGDS